ncbi:AAA family ATPase [uncultured Porphyromonas sp.]|jgi:AAA15 family ATPase/GTPase|uniref:AAA family ATPase n=1 Tax=uncultured Porphyromonas sp. TaxID=159274 RepID=UPI0026261FD7|nr:AAA family ATPase [uncultured Porphyromonas sp.]
MQRYIQAIHINKVRHLHDLDIYIPDDEHPHLLITGKNGSGKTSLLEAIRDHIALLQKGQSLDFLKYEEYIQHYTQRLTNGTNPLKSAELEQQLAFWQERLNELYGKVRVEFENPTQIVFHSSDKPFICAMYAASREVRMSEPLSPTKPMLSDQWLINQSVSDQFLNFLSDLKIQEALARNEHQTEDADRINDWFVSFEALLGEIFGDSALKLSFNYKDYSFHIETEGKSFKFNELSDGFAAVIDIISDLILRMNSISDRTMQLYDIPGIVLIDEVETHLHLSLQRQVMPLLTRVFPKIQFIITTHSPFVLNSIASATVYDLEHQKVLTNLSDYSYEALAEGYFEVSTRSSYLEQQLNRLTELLKQADLDLAERFEVKELVKDLDKVSESVSPKIAGEYEELKIRWADKLSGIRDYDSNL